jgi:hypothetical protein
MKKNILFQILLICSFGCSPVLRQYNISNIPKIEAKNKCNPLIVFDAQFDTIQGTLLQRIITQKNIFTGPYKMINDTALLKSEACKIGANLINISYVDEGTLYLVDDDKLGYYKHRCLDSIRYRDSIFRYSNPKDTVVYYDIYEDLDKKYLLWYFPSENTITNGLSVGLYNRKGEVSNLTNGIRMELFGVGIFHFIHPSGAIVDYSPDEYNKIIGSIPFLENVNGLNFSLTGTFLGEVNGISVGGLSSVYGRMTGLSIAIVNSAWDSRGMQVGVHTQNFKSRGIHLGVIRNSTQVLSGIQIGLFNESRVTKGIQIGLWNVNEKRKLPIFNANFK